MKQEIKKGIINSTQPNIKVIIAILKTLNSMGDNKIKFWTFIKNLDMIPLGIAHYLENDEWIINERCILQLLSEISLKDLEIKPETQYNHQGANCNFFLDAFNQEKKSFVGTTFEKTCVNWICETAHGKKFGEYFKECANNFSDFGINDKEIFFQNMYLGITVNKLDYIINNPFKFYRLSTQGKWDAVCCFKLNKKIILFVIAFKYSDSIITQEIAEKNMQQSSTQTPFLKNIKKKKIGIFSTKCFINLRKQYVESMKNVNGVVRVCIEMDKSFNFRKPNQDSTYSYNDEYKIKTDKKKKINVEYAKNYKESLLNWNGNKLNKLTVGVKGSKIIEIIRKIKITKKNNTIFKVELDKIDFLPVFNILKRKRNESQEEEDLQKLKSSGKKIKKRKIDYESWTKEEVKNWINSIDKNDEWKKM